MQRTVYSRAENLGGFAVTEHHWLFFESVYWNVISSDAVYNRDGSKHHMEILVEKVRG